MGSAVLADAFACRTGGRDLDDLPTDLVHNDIMIGEADMHGRGYGPMTLELQSYRDFFELGEDYRYLTDQLATLRVCQPRTATGSPWQTLMLLVTSP